MVRLWCGVRQGSGEWSPGRFALVKRRERRKRKAVFVNDVLFLNVWKFHVCKSKVSAVRSIEMKRRSLETARIGSNPGRHAFQAGGIHGF